VTFKRFVVLVAGLSAGLFGLWLTTVGLILLAGARPGLRPADAILVLGAAQYNGRPSPVLRARLDHALDLWRRGLAGHLIFTGGVGQGDTLSEGEVARRYALESGVPDSIILVEREGVTSSASVEAAAALMRGRGLHSALLVSDSYHMLRLELLARRAGIQPFRAPTPGSPIDRDRATHRRYVLRESLLLPGQAVLGGR
jgi:uncharacterized SAM-binding protein YcdF (DUF218 family)